MVVAERRKQEKEKEEIMEEKFTLRGDL